MHPLSICTLSGETCARTEAGYLNLHSYCLEVQIYEKCPNITKDKIAKNYIILTVSSTQGPEALEYIWFSTLLDLYHGKK